MLVRIDALGIHEISLRKRDEALKLLAEWLPRGRAADDDTGLEAEAVLAAAERSALVTVTRYTTHGSAESAGASTDLVLVRRDGRLHAFTRDNADSKLEPGGLNGQEVTEVLAGLLSPAS